ncbi:MAG: hypothetical protein ACE5LU_24550 [Anaerolineae bacterium]
MAIKEGDHLADQGSPTLRPFDPSTGPWASGPRTEGSGQAPSTLRRSSGQATLRTSYTQDRQDFGETSSSSAETLSRDAQDIAQPPTVALFPDTRPEAEAVLIGLLRQAPPWRKLHMVSQLNQTVRTLALSGLRARHPDATPQELRRRLADLLLGADLAAQVYGPLGEQEDLDAL